MPFTACVGLEATRCEAGKRDPVLQFHVKTRFENDLSGFEWSNQLWTSNYFDFVRESVLYSCIFLYGRMELRGPLPNLGRNAVCTSEDAGLNIGRYGMVSRSLSGHIVELWGPWEAGCHRSAGSISAKRIGDTLHPSLMWFHTKRVTIVTSKMEREISHSIVGNPLIALHLVSITLELFLEIWFIQPCRGYRYTASVV